MLEGYISVSGSKGDASVRLRQLLEKLELDLRDGDDASSANRGLGSNNLLFMACELLLLGSEARGIPASSYRGARGAPASAATASTHAIPAEEGKGSSRRQSKNPDHRNDTQSEPGLRHPNLTTLVLLSKGKAFPLCSGRTELAPSDYGFLGRFLDATKANLFFARGLMIVEGDAENILLPTLARILQRDFTANGVSIVNVGGIGLRRFARIFQRKAPATDGVIPVPVACVTDLDVMPDCAPEITGRVIPGKTWPEKNNRRWRAKKDYTPQELTARREVIRDKASGQNVKTFVADEWTLEYNLAYAGLAREVFVAARLAAYDERIAAGNVKAYVVARQALRDFDDLAIKHPEKTNLPPTFTSRLLMIPVCQRRQQRSISPVSCNPAIREDG